jgi:hypothetical protein
MSFPQTKFLQPALAILSLFATGAFAQTSNGILREVYYNISGSAVANLTSAPNYPARPDEEFIDTAFEAPVNFSDNYGQRMRALLIPPVTGNYVFWISSDDNSVLYLSTDADPAHKVQVASLTQWTNSRQWNMYPSQKSAAISLTNGFRYYIEALQKEGGGGDNLAVTWQKPGDAAPADGAAPIPGSNLAPYGLGPPIITVQPANAAVVEYSTAAFTVQLSHVLGAAFQWQRNGASIPGATNSTYFISPAGLSDNGSAFRCFITNAYGNTNSATATLTVNPDLTRPALTSVGSLGDPETLTVVFSEPVEAASATAAGNYTFDNGVRALAAVFGSDNRTIILTTTPMVSRTTYTLTVNNVRDRATTPNAILPNSQRTFTLDSTPLDISFVRPSPEPIGPSTRHGPVIISEIMYHPTNRVDGKNLEFIELFNSNPYFEDISGYRLTGEIEFTFPSNTVFAARTYLVVAASPEDLHSVYGITNVIGSFTNKLSNGSGTIRLRNRQGGIVFEVNYSGNPPWPAAADGAGHSLVLARPSLGERNPDTWAASDVMGGSPGQAETSLPNPYRAIVINEFLSHTDPPDFDFIELFNYSSTAVDLSNCILSDDPTANRFIIPANTVIQPQSFVYFDETRLGFALNAAGETIYFKDPNSTRVIDAVRFGAQENGVSMGRYPDGAAGFHRLQTKSPGARNGSLRIPEVVINEIMYNPVSGDSNDEYVELHNRTTDSIDLGGWSFTDGIDYVIPVGTTIPADGYLVIAKNAARLLTNYPGLNGANTVGDFEGTLANGGEHLALSMPDEIASTNALGQVVTNLIHIVVDDVTVGTGGRWGKWAHGGGSSLELIDARSDHRLAPNWADSDEMVKSAWKNIEVTGVLDNGNGAANALQIILLGPGECLVDNLEVFASGGANLIQNPDFESGITGWVAQGNHEDSGLEIGQGYNNSSRCLHVRATDRGDTGANRIRTNLKSTLNSGQTATIRAKVRWLAGHPEILFRLKGNWLEAVGNTLTARNLGTPGMANSRTGPNAGPAITDVQHSPVLPAVNQPVTVTARVHDPDGLATLLLKYRIDPSTNLNVVTMANNGAGLFSATISGQAAGALVAFHIQASDNFSPGAMSRFPNDAPVRECLARWADPAQGGNFGTYRVWMTQATLNRWSNREHLSNKPLDCTFVYGNYRAVYNIGGQYSGSPYHSPGFNSPTGNVCDYVLTFPEDDPLLGETDFTLQWPGNGGGDNTYQREQTAYWIASEIGLPYCYRRHINLFINGVRRAQMFEDAQQPNGDMTDEFYPEGADGNLHKVQLWFEFDDAAVSFTSNGASLANYTTSGGQKKVARYRWTFAKRAVQDSASNFTNLFTLVDAVNFSTLGVNYRRQLESVVDVDNWLGTYAVEHLVGNNDSFAYGGGQNMYSYKPTGDTWKMMIWDIDFAFNAQGPTADMFQGIGRSNGIDLGEPAYRRRYWQILQDLANGPLVATRANPILNAKYNAMTANGRTVDSPASIQNYISQRRSNLLGLIAANVSSTFSIKLNNGADFSTNRNLIALTGTAAIGVRTITVNGVAFPVTWTTVTNWITQVALGGAFNALTIRGLDAQGNLVSGATATINVNYTGVIEQPQDNLVINEIMYHPSVPDASFVELYNNSTVSAFDLSGWRLSGAAFTFPGGSVIGPGGFLVVAGDRGAFAAAYGRIIALVGEFSGKLENGGETLRLIQPGATPEEDLIVDEVRYDSAPPWPDVGNGGGASLQLIDPAQDNNRVSNWSAVPTNVVPAKPRFTPGAQNSVRASLPAMPQLWLNEVLPNNFGGATDRFGHPHPWCELYNGGTTAIDLAGFCLANNYSNLTQWAFPPGTTIGAGKFLPVWLDGNLGESTIGEYHTSFTIPPDTGSLALAQTNGGKTNLLDYLNYAVTKPDVSFGAYPDGAVSGRRTFYYVTPAAPNNPASPPLAVLVNEWMADNVTTLADPADGDFEDWFEIYNPGDVAADLSGFYLGTSLTNKTQFPFPSGCTIQPHGYLLVWADSEPGQNSSNRADLHASFKLSKAGDAIGIFAADGTVIDFVSFGPQATDVSEGRFPDGSSPIYDLTTPTPRAINFLATPNTAPVIASANDRVVIEGQLLLFSATAADSDAPAQTLTFSLDADAPAGATINSVTGLFLWRPTAAQAPGMYSITARVTDNGAPPMSASTTFTVRVAPRPQVTGVTPKTNGGYAISFVTVPEKTYRVEFKNALEESNWQQLDADLVATGETYTINDDLAGGSQRFYRILVLD